VIVVARQEAGRRVCGPFPGQFVHPMQRRAGWRAPSGPDRGLL